MLYFAHILSPNSQLLKPMPPFYQPNSMSSLLSLSLKKGQKSKNKKEKLKQTKKNNKRKHNKTKQSK